MRLLTLSSIAVLGGALACGGSSSSEPLSAQRLAFTAQPASTYEGESLGTVTVELRDYDGKAMSGLSSPVSLSLLNGAPLGGTTQVQAVNGVATFSDLHVDSPGAALELVATVGGTQATSAPFNALPVVLHVNVPQDASLPGALAPVTVTATDGVGQPISSITRAVTLSLEGAGTLGGTTTQTLQNGVATFADLSVSDADASLMATAPAAIPGEAKTHVAYSVDEIERADLQGGPRNDTPDTAQRIPPGVPLFGSLETAGDVDVYTFAAHAGDFLSVDTVATRMADSPWTTDVQLELLDTDGSTVLWTNNNVDEDWWGGHYADLAFDHVRIPADGTYYLRLSPDLSTSQGLVGGPYAVRLDLTPSPAGLQVEQEPVGTGGQNDSFATAESLLPGWLVGWHTDATPVDFFHISVTGPTRVHGQLFSERNGLAANGTGTYDSEVFLETSSGTTLWSGDDGHVLDGFVDALITQPSADGYYLDIDKCCNAGDAPYLFHLDPEPVTLTAETAGNDAQATAMTVTEGQYVSGAVTGTEHHWFEVQGTAGQRISVHLFGGGNSDVGTSSLQAKLFDANGAQLPQASSSDNYNAVGAILAADGPVWVDVTASAATPFTVVVEDKQDAPWEVEPNDTAAQASALDEAGWAAGIIDATADVDTYAFTAQKDQVIDVSVLAAEPNQTFEYFFDKWGSALYPKLTITDAAGNEIATRSYPNANYRVDAESEQNPLATSEIVFRAAQAGTYFVSVTDSAGLGEADYRYQLHVLKDLKAPAHH